MWMQYFIRIATLLAASHPHWLRCAIVVPCAWIYGSRVDRGRVHTQLPISVAAEQRHRQQQWTDCLAEIKHEQTIGIDLIGKLPNLVRFDQR